MLPRIHQLASRTHPSWSTIATITIIHQDCQCGPGSHSDTAHLASNKTTVLSPIITQCGRLSVLGKIVRMICASVGGITLSSHRRRHAAQLFLPISTFSQTVLSLNRENHQCPSLPARFKWQGSIYKGSKNMTISWCMLGVIERDRKHVCYYPRRNDSMAFTTIKKDLKWDTFQNTEQEVSM